MGSARRKRVDLGTALLVLEQGLPYKLNLHLRPNVSYNVTKFVWPALCPAAHTNLRFLPTECLTRPVMVRTPASFSQTPLSSTLEATQGQTLSQSLTDAT